MGHLEASQFNGAHYGNQLNAEQRDKCELFTSPSPDIQQLLMGAHLQPSSVIQPSLAAPLAHLQGQIKGLQQRPSSGAALGWAGWEEEEMRGWGDARRTKVAQKAHSAPSIPEEC